jgi:hypothetical protein
MRLRRGAEFAQAHKTSDGVTDKKPARRWPGSFPLTGTVSPYRALDGLLVLYSVRICGIPAKNGRFSAPKTDLGCRMVGYLGGHLLAESPRPGHVARMSAKRAGPGIPASHCRKGSMDR